MNTLQFKQVDVFTQTSFFGNPVAVVLDGNVAALLGHTGLIGQFGTDYIARQGMRVGRDGYIAVSVDGHDVKFGGFAVTCVDGRLRIR